MSFDGLIQWNQLLRSRKESVEYQYGSRRFIRRFGGSCRGTIGCLCDGHGYRRSIRQPAALSYYRFKAHLRTRIPLRHDCLCLKSDQGGPMTHSAEDAAVMLQTMAGFDEKDSTSWLLVPNYRAGLNHSLRAWKSAYPKSFWRRFKQHVAATLETAINEYRKLGAEIKEISMPNLKLAIPAYYVIAPAECSANLSRSMCALWLSLWKPSGFNRSLYPLACEVLVKKLNAVSHGYLCFIRRLLRCLLY